MRYLFILNVHALAKKNNQKNNLILISRFTMYGYNTATYWIVHKYGIYIHFTEKHNFCIHTFLVKQTDFVTQDVCNKSSAFQCDTVTNKNQAFGYCI